MEAGQDPITTTAFRCAFGCLALLCWATIGPTQGGSISRCPIPPSADVVCELSRPLPVGRDAPLTKKNANRRFFKGVARGLRLSTAGFKVPLKRSFPQRGFGVGHLHDEATYRVLIASRRNNHWRQDSTVSAPCSAFHAFRTA